MPRKKNVFIGKGKALVSIEKSYKPIEQRVKAAVDMIGGFSKVIKKGESVLIKPNFVFPTPPPCTTDPELLVAVIKQCYKAGASQVVVGESAAYWVDTETCMRKLGVIEPIEATGAKISYFDQEPWVEVMLNGNTIKSAGFPEEAFKHNKIILLPTMKTHHLARFSMSFKLAYGFLSTRYRTAQMHFVNLEEKIAEVNKAIHPDLIIMDGRKSFVTGGPEHGDVVAPNVILASGDRIAIDIEGLRILQSYNAKNKLTFKNPFDFPTIKRAVELDLGVHSEKEIKVIMK